MKTQIFTPVIFALLLAANICKAQDTIVGYSDTYDPLMFAYFTISHFVLSLISTFKI